MEIIGLRINQKQMIKQVGKTGYRKRIPFYIRNKNGKRKRISFLVRR